MQVKTLKILRDPLTFDTLVESNSGIVNPQTGSIYSVKKGIIRFINEDEITGNNKKYLKLYNKIAPLYHFANKLYFQLKFGGERAYREEFLSELEIKDGDQVIEISVGTGDNFPFLPRNIDLYGLDISLGMLEQANRHMKRWGIEAQLFQGEGENLPFQDEVFDVVYHVGGINYFNDKRQAITEMIRIAKSGSKILIVDETEKLLKGTYRKTPIISSYYKEEQNISAPIELIPKEMLEITYKEICKGLMYCLTFRKP